MEQPEARVRRLLTTFFRSSGMEALYFDEHLNAVSCNFSKHTYEDFLRLSRGRVEGFLQDVFGGTQCGEHTFFTYFLNNNLVCNIAVLAGDETPFGVVVTRPALLNALRASDLAAMGRLICDPAEQEQYREALKRAPVVPYERIMPMGEVLHALCRTMFLEQEVLQVLRGTDGPSARPQAKRSHKPVPAQRHGDFATYQKITGCIARGDADALLEAISGISAGLVPMDQLDPSSFVRSLKNSFIKACAMCCFAAVDAGASYNKVMDISDEFISRMEATDGINDIYELMKAALLAFARCVAVSRITAYSKPVRLAMEYIENHYNEKITLETLAEKASISVSYLSNLMKKETGLSLADNINKIRIENSKKILLGSNVSIAELANTVGFTYGNHFSLVFKKFTGLMPSEYKRSIHAQNDGNGDNGEMIRLICDQLGQIMAAFPGMFDAGRVVDPVANTFWMQQTDGKMLHGTCYDFWEKNQSCDNCISRMALEKNCPYVKLERREDGVFFVLAAPKAAANKTYAVELIKAVSDNFLAFPE